MITNDEGETFNSVKLVSKGFVANKDDPDKLRKFIVLYTSKL